MEAVKTRHERYVFVCENEKPGQSCCMPQGSAIRQRLKERIQESGLAARIRVSRSGCLDVCADGPNVLLMPDGVWFRNVKEDDVEKIFEVLQKGAKQ